MLRLLQPLQPLRLLRPLDLQLDSRFLQKLRLLPLARRGLPLLPPPLLASQLGASSCRMQQGLRRLLEGQLDSSRSLLQEGPLLPLRPHPLKAPGAITSRTAVVRSLGKRGKIVPTWTDFCASAGTRASSMTMRALRQARRR